MTTERHPAKRFFYSPTRTEIVLEHKFVNDRLVGCYVRITNPHAESNRCFDTYEKAAEVFKQEVLAYL